MPGTVLGDLPRQQPRLPRGQSRRPGRVPRPRQPVRAAAAVQELPAGAGRPFTAADLDRMPYDGRRFELLDGTLIVSPRPSTVHQLACTGLIVTLS
ncbi:MAG: hypothetical protein ACLP7J_04665, partial [Streptosporangiaceae bacterium]